MSAVINCTCDHGPLSDPLKCSLSVYFPFAVCVCGCVCVQKNQRELTKMRKCLRPEELASQVSQMDTQLQHEELERGYQDVLGEYRRIIERLARA